MMRPRHFQQLACCYFGAKAGVADYVDIIAQDSINFLLEVDTLEAAVRKEDSSGCDQEP